MSIGPSQRKSTKAAGRTWKGQFWEWNDAIYHKLYLESSEATYLGVPVL